MSPLINNPTVDLHSLNQSLTGMKIEKDKDAPVTTCTSSRETKGRNQATNCHKFLHDQTQHQTRMKIIYPSRLSQINNIIKAVLSNSDEAALIILFICERRLG